MAFDKKSYDKEYCKNNYKKCTTKTKLDLYRKIDEYCKYNGMSINEFFNSAAKYILNEKIDLQGYK